MLSYNRIVIYFHDWHYFIKLGTGDTAMVDKIRTKDSQSQLVYCQFCKVQKKVPVSDGLSFLKNNKFKNST